MWQEVRKIDLVRSRHDWREFIHRNKGPIMVEKDFNYPGGFYVRHKEAGRFCITGTRWDFENLAENILAALGVNCGRIIVHCDEEKTCLSKVKRIALEGLDKQLISWLEEEGIKNAFIKKQFFMNMLWEALADIRVNERAPAMEVNLRNETVTAKTIIEREKQSKLTLAF